jgi:nitrile hydratase
MTNGALDMGWMHGFGRVDYDLNEPVFHEPWEGRMYSIMAP